MIAHLIIFATAFLATFVALYLAIPALKREGIVGRDVNKPDQPTVAEMGGLGLIGGFSAGLIVAIGAESFVRGSAAFDLVTSLAVLSSVLLIALIGILDDLLTMSQRVKAVLPLIGALPLMAVKAGDTTMILPFAGPVNLGLLYPLVVVPLSLTGAANIANMLGGFNGLEAGMGLIAVGSLAVVAYLVGAPTALIVLVAALGALLATLYFNWYPARIFVGDVGTLGIGAVIAASAIIGNFEVAAGIVLIPYALDFPLKAWAGFPSKGWWGVYREGKLHCPDHGPVGLAQFVMRLSRGISERRLVLVLMGIEAICGLVAILYFARQVLRLPP